MPDPVPPSPVLLFGIMFVAVLGALALIFFFAFLTRTIERVKSGGLVAAFPYVQQRSKPVYRSLNVVQKGSRQQNAKYRQRSGVQPFKKGSDLNGVPALATADELQKLAHAIVLYAKRPNKELAIEAAWNCTKGAGDDWKRGLMLFDSAMGEKAMEVAKGKN